MVSELACQCQLCGKNFHGSQDQFEQHLIEEHNALRYDELELKQRTYWKRVVDCALAINKAPLGEEDLKDRIEIFSK